MSRPLESPASRAILEKQGKPRKNNEKLRKAKEKKGKNIRPAKPIQKSSENI